MYTTIRFQPKSYEEVANEVSKITDTQNTYSVTVPTRRICNAENYSDYGLGTLGRMVGFPASFIKQVYATNPELANEVITDRVNHYFADGRPEFFAREFLGKIQGVVSNRYAYFDDNQVMDIIGNSILASFDFANAIVTPERLHLRAIDRNHPFTVGDDNSELYFAYFVDNSMVGGSSFRVQLGVFRLVCTNGMIVPIRECILCRQIHRGNKDITADFNESIAFLAEKQESIRDLLTSAGREKSSLEELREEFRRDYLTKKLNLNQKEAEKIITLYHTTYGGWTKWAMMQAVTEFARDVKDIDRRTFLERNAFKVA